MLIVSFFYTNRKKIKIRETEKRVAETIVLAARVASLACSSHEYTNKVKTVLQQNENNDGRPILYRKDYGFKNFDIVMGGKIDNIYDVCREMQKVNFVFDLCCLI